MKKLTALLLFSIALTFAASAQQDTTSFFGKSNYMFHYLDKNQISTGLMSDYGIEFLKLANYSGTVLADSNYVGLQEWRLLYTSLYSAQINGTANMLYLDTINNRVLNYISLNQPITFAVLHYNYQSIRTDAVSANLITVSNDQMFDVSGRTQSPYQNNQVVAVAPIRQTAVMGSNSMIFRPELFFSNTGKTLSSIAIDVGETGTYQTVTFNSPFNINFTQAGFVNISIRITYTDSSISYAHTKVLVYPYPEGNEEQLRTGISQKGQNGINIFGGDRALVHTVLTATKAYLGQYATGDITIQLALNNTTGSIRKPLIVVEGFDIDNSYSFRSFIRSIGEDENTSNPTQSITLNDGLDNINNYDLIFLNFANATDYIQRNAFLLERVIQYVNANKINYNGVRQDNVIIGLSMGGLVTRYALRDMELNSEAHETRLFISHDTPHHGANIPVGAQVALQHLAPFKIVNVSNDFPWVKSIGWKDMFPEIVAAQDAFDSPAAKQMLIQRYILNPIDYTLISDNTNYTTFYSELNTMGWPTVSKNITLSNGSCNGAGIPNFPANTRIFQMIGNRPMSYGGQLWRSAVMSVGAPITPIAISGADINSRNLLIQFPLALFSTKSSVNLDFRINAVPTSVGELYRGDIYVKRKLAWVINSNSYIIKTRVNSVSGMLPLDNAPGGMADINQFGVDASLITNALPSFFDGIQAQVLQPKFCLVPTVSALAITNPWQNLNNNLGNTVNCTNPSAVKNYFAAQQNTLHISYTQPMADWVLQWQDPSFDCPKICQSNYSISGPSQFCTSATYSIPSLPTGATVSWSTNAPSGFTLTPSGNSVTLTETGTVTERTDILTATISSSCNTFTLQTNITHGVPNTSAGIGKMWGGGPQAWFFTIGGTIPQSPIKFDVQSTDGSLLAPFPPTGPASTSLTNIAGIYPYNYGGSNWVSNPLVLNVRARNSCGTSDWQTVYIDKYSSAMYSVYPNPVSNELTVSYSEVGSEETKNSNSFASTPSGKMAPPFSIKLFDEKNKLLFSGNNKDFGRSIKTNVQYIPNGIYFLHIFSGKSVIKKQIIISH